MGGLKKKKSMEIDQKNLVKKLLDKDQRKEILSAIKKEEGSYGELTNKIANLAYEAEFSNEEIRQLLEVLSKEGHVGESIFDDFIFNKSFPEDLLYELYDSNKYKCALAHRSGPFELLFKIAREKNGYDEAILTIGESYYELDSISTEVFKAFIEEFNFSEWLLRSLIQCYSYNNKTDTLVNNKTEILIEVIKKSDYKEELIPLYEEIKMSKNIMITDDVDFIIEKYKLKVPRYFQAISLNKNTPPDILNELSKVSGIKFAKDIRVNSLNNLKNRKNQSHPKDNNNG